MKLTLDDGFLKGMIFWAGLHMAVQDAMGLDAFLTYAASHWIQLPWSVGAGIAAILSKEKK